MNRSAVGLLGARSLVGTHLISQLQHDNINPVPFSRNNIDSSTVSWKKLESDSHFNKSTNPIELPIEFWISLMPIWELPQYFNMLKQYGVKNIVAVSSTSLFTKTNSANSAEQDVAKLLADGETRLLEWAQRNAISCTVLRPTLIYGGESDKNISELARFIQRLHFFPILGSAQGLRQPIHARDVACACRLALIKTTANTKFYNISGAEVLSYREMVRRVFIMLGKKPFFIPIPIWIFKLGVWLLKIVPRYRKWNPEMAERMNADLVFDHTLAAVDLGFKPQRFQLNPLEFSREPVKSRLF